jgi:hypothetical protein
LSIGDPGTSGTRKTVAPPASATDENAAAALSMTRSSRVMPTSSDIAAA